MDLREDCCGTEREQAENETQSADHLLSTKEPDRSPDGRLMYYEHQVQRSEWYQGGGFLDDISIDEARALLEELLDYSGVCSSFSYPLPPAGLPGHLHAEYSKDEPAGDLIEIGLGYVSAVVRNERRSMHNRWDDARQFIYKIEQQVRKECEDRYIALHVQQAEERQASIEATPQFVYFIGSVDGPIKIGITINVQSRLKGLQTSQHGRLEVLATCSGDADLERAYHKRFASRRLNGEWFERCPEIEVEIAKLSQEDNNGLG